MYETFCMRSFDFFFFFFFFFWLRVSPIVTRLWRKLQSQVVEASSMNDWESILSVAWVNENSLKSKSCRNIICFLFIFWNALISLVQLHLVQGLYPLTFTLHGWTSQACQLFTPAGCVWWSLHASGRCVSYFGPTRMSLTVQNLGSYSRKDT